MSALESAMQSLAATAQDLERTARDVAAAKEGITLLNKAELRARKLKPGDIKRLPEVWLPGRAHPLYQLADVQNYLNSRKAKPKI